ncbi:ribose 1,5-bisphosphokinase [Escherichia coli]|nr:ribose 1,5-bisphosphokinase [Escherichia coli]
MMGKLIWLMGPSGSGKDSLLAELRLREQTQLLVAHRYITRDASAGSEKPYRPERAGVFYPRGAEPTGLKLAR